MRTQGRAVTTKVLEGFSGGLWDLKANLMADMVDQHGARSSVKWFASNMPTYEKILKLWGPLRTHIVIVAISATNGCGYCTFGSAYAFQLHWFEITNTVFPLDEHQMQALSTENGESIALTLDGSLKTADSDEATELRPCVDRVMSVLDGTEQLNPDDEDDKCLQHLIDMFAFLNACGIAGNTEPDGAHDPINKNHDLQEAYKTARFAK